MERENLMATVSRPEKEHVKVPHELASEDYVVKTMPRVANTFDLTATFVLIIFFSTNVASATQGGVGTFTYWIVGGITFFVPCIIATAQLGHMFPYEGSLYNWTHRAFGGFWSFFVAFCAWFPCIFLMVTAASVVVGYIQQLNANWLVQPWQQGLVLILLIIFSGVLALQRFRTVLNIVRVTLVVAFVTVLLVGIAGIVWMLRGMHPVVSFQTASDWGLTLTPRGYSSLALFGFITQAYLGVEAPLNMAGEISEHNVIRRHLRWGLLLVFAGYLITTFGVLVVEGTSANGNPFVLVMTVQAALGKTLGSIVAILIMMNFMVTPAVYNYTYARLLMVSGIDRFLPSGISRLNHYRVPSQAVIFQTTTAVFFTGVIYIVVPVLTGPTNAVVLNSDIYNVVISASTLVWAISTAFLFINLIKFYIVDRRAFRERLIFPMPVIWLCIFFGTVTCVISIVGTLLYSLIPQQIDNAHWWYIVGGITGACLVVAAGGGMWANSEAAWQSLKD
jgi:amino acid transporter